VVLPEVGERDVVVDLADLEQGARRVSGPDDDAVDSLERDEAPAARDALARIVGAVLHDLLGRDVEGHRHWPAPSSRPPSSAVARGSTSSSVMSRNPSASTTATVGKMRRTRSGPPVAGSSSAAANSERSAGSMGSAAGQPSRRCALTQFLAWPPPDRLTWKSDSSYLPPATSKLTPPPRPRRSSYPAKSGTTTSPWMAAGRFARTI